MEVDHDSPNPPSPGHTVPDAPMPAALPSPDPGSVAEAIERRLRQQAQQTQPSSSTSFAAFDADHEKRQAFRRMIDPGILRPNPRPLALESIKTLLVLAENIIKHPDEPKYQRFKPTNANINRLLVSPAGTLEYAREMGFNPEVENFQPYYVFNKKKHMTDLKIGASILKEALDRETEKEERAARAKRDEKAVAAAQVANIKQAFLDDRKQRTLVEDRERQLREARAAAKARGLVQKPETPPPPMPGSGHLLSGEQVPVQNVPTADDEDADADADGDEDRDEE